MAFLKRRVTGPFVAGRDDSAVISERVNPIGSSIRPGAFFLVRPDFRLDLAVVSEAAVSFSAGGPGSGLAVDQHLRLAPGPSLVDTHTEVDMADSALALACLVTRTEDGAGSGGAMEACSGTAASTFCRFVRRRGVILGVDGASS